MSSANAKVKNHENENPMGSLIHELVNQLSHSQGYAQFLDKKMGDGHEHKKIVSSIIEANRKIEVVIEKIKALA